MVSSTPAVSVIICTLDRAQDIATCLKSLIDQEGIAQAEIIVVNDGTTDRTLEVVAKLRDRLNVRFVKAGFRSLGKARNLGFREAIGSIVAYLDDDAVAEAGWLSSLFKDFAEMDEAFVGQTGPVSPNGSWESEKDWVHPSVAGQLFSLAEDRPSADIHYPQCLLGCNMAFRRDFLLQCGGFSADIQSFDEAFVVWPAMKNKYRFYFNRKMRARHRIDPSRLKPAFLWKKFRGQGAAYQRLLPLLRARGFGPPPLSILWEWVRPAGGYLISFFLRDRPRRTAFAAKLAFWWGRWEGLAGSVGDYYEKSTPS